MVIAFQKCIDQLRRQLHEQELSNQAQDQNSEEIERTKKYKRLFLDILDQYSKFIEVTIREAPGQGRFLLPSPLELQKTLENDNSKRTLLELLFEPKESTSKCAPENYAFLPLGPCHESYPEPMQLGACQLKPEPSIAQPEPELAPTSSSLSCFNFNNDIFASNKVS